MSNVIEMCKVQTYVSIDKLQAHPKNPRTIKAERLDDLKSSIVEKGFYQPILVWKRGGIVLSGNHRLKAAQELIDDGWVFKSPNGEKNVLPVVIEDVSDEVAEEMLFESNNTYADWIDNKLKEAIQEAEDNGRNLKGYGFTKEEVDKMLGVALADAEDILVESHSRKLAEPKVADISELAEVEEFDSIILPKVTYKKFTDILKDISKALNPSWIEGDSYDIAVQSLIQVIEDNDIVNGIAGAIEPEHKDAVAEFMEDIDKAEKAAVKKKAKKKKK